MSDPLRATSSTVGTVAPALHAAVGAREPAIVQVPASAPSVSSSALAPPHADQPRPIELSGRLQQVLEEMRDGSPCLHTRCGPQVMDAASLMSEVGRKPTADRLFGLYKMSEHYKAVTGALDNYHELLQQRVGIGAPVAGTKEGPGQADALFAQLREIDLAADAYIAKHGKSTKEADRAAVAAMQKLKEQIQHETTYIGQVANSAARIQGMSWKDAVTGANYRLLDAISAHNDARLNTGRSVEQFGSGAINSVSKLVYGSRETIFKPDPAKAPPEAEDILAKIGVSAASPNFAARNVATAYLSEALGQSCAPHCTFALHNGRIGIAMDMAPGRSPQIDEAVRISDDQMRVYTGQARELDQDLDAMLKDMNIAKKSDGHYYRSVPKVDIAHFTAGLDDPMKARVEANWQRELVSLQWLDAISGQVDRHGGNYLVGVDRATGNVTVTGIDNDFSFGRQPTRAAADAIGRKELGLPPLIDRGMADRLTGMDFDRDVAPTLGTLLSRDEVDAAKARFTQVKTEAARLVRDGKVVDDWQAWRDGERTAGQVLVAARDNYWAREQALHAEAARAARV